MNLTEESKKFLQDWKVKIENKIKEIEEDNKRVSAAANPNEFDYGRGFGYAEALNDCLTRVDMLLAENPIEDLAAYTAMSNEEYAKTLNDLVNITRVL